MRIPAFSVAFAVAFAGAGCSTPPPSPQVSITGSGAASQGAGLTSSLASVPVGAVIELTIAPTETEDTVTVTVDDPTLAMAAPMTVKDQFILVGLAPGSTTLHVFLNGQETHVLSLSGVSATTLPVDVTQQPPPS